MWFFPGRYDVSGGFLCYRWRIEHQQEGVECMHNFSWFLLVLLTTDASGKFLMWEGDHLYFGLIIKQNFAWNTDYLPFLTHCNCPFICKNTFFSKFSYSHQIYQHIIILLYVFKAYKVVQYSNDVQRQWKIESIPSEQQTWEKKCKLLFHNLIYN